MKTILRLSLLTTCLCKIVYAANNIACPEQIGGELQACQNCGNEDVNNPGHCTNPAFDGSQCGCNPSILTAPIETAIVTALPPGATANVTGTYALATLTAFSTLRQSITTTVTTSPEETGEPAVEVAVVIFAAGVAWYLASGVGGEAAALTEPPNEAGAHPDDPQCPNPKFNCEDCGGAGSVCTSPNGGCACEDTLEACPQEKPQCDAETCQGDENNKCTVDNIGCDCEVPQQVCPQEKPLCDAETCQGDENNKCAIENIGCDCEIPQQVCPQEDPLCDAETCQGDENNKCTVENIGCDCEAPQEVCPPETPICDVETCQGDENNKCTIENIGCDCEVPQQVCPQEKPTCDVETCQGDENNRCTVENQGCDCENTESSCPDPTDAMFCSTCGGEESDTTKCSDGAPCCIGPENPGCPCYEDENPNILGYQSPSDLEPAQEWQDHLQDPVHNQPACNGVSTVNPSFFTNIYHQFCIIANDGEGHDWTRLIPPSAPMYGGFRFGFKATGGGTCRSCEAAFLQIMESCLGETGFMASEGSIDIGCGSYSYKI